MQTLLAIAVCLLSTAGVMAAAIIYVSSNLRQLRQEIIENDNYLRLQREISIYKILFKDSPEVMKILDNMSMLDSGDVRYIDPETLRQVCTSIVQQREE